MRRLSVRDRGNGMWEVGPAGHGPVTTTVRARSRCEALHEGKKLLRSAGLIQLAAAKTFRNNKNIKTIKEVELTPVEETL